MPVVRVEKCKPQYSSMKKNNIFTSEYELPLDSSYEISREHLTLGKTLGEGAFGKVIKADCLNIIKPGIHSIVAVKMLKGNYVINKVNLYLKKSNKN